MPELIRIDDADPAARFLFLLGGGGRHGGATEVLARSAAAGLPARTARRWLRLSDLPLPAFRDDRCGPPGPPSAPLGAERVLLEATLEATDVVIVTPLYWYSVCAATKLYLDHWARWMGRPDLDYRERMRGKTLWAIASCASPDPADADPLAGMLRRTARHLSMHWGGLLLNPGEGRPRASGTPHRAAGPCDGEGRPVRAAAFFDAAVAAAC